MNPFLVRFAIAAAAGFFLGSGITFFIGLSVPQIFVAGLVGAALVAIALLFMPVLKR